MEKQVTPVKLFELDDLDMIIWISVRKMLLLFGDWFKCAKLLRKTGLIGLAQVGQLKELLKDLFLFCRLTLILFIVFFGLIHNINDYNR